MHCEAFPQNMRAEDAPDRFVLVTILEEKNVPGMWGRGTYKGYRASGDDGRVYLLNWSSFPDDSMTPTWMWYLEMDEKDDAAIHKAIKENDAAWYDVTQGMTFIPFRPRIVDQYPDVIEYCSTHQRLSYKDHDGCFYCKHGLDGGLPPVDHSWKGWR